MKITASVVLLNFIHHVISFLIIISIFPKFSLQKAQWQQQCETEITANNNQRIEISANNKQEECFTNNGMRISNALKMLQSVDFEVFGRVQGVFFRKYTQSKAKELGLKGWCMNTSRDTVTGTIQGKEEKIEEMKDWLRHTGSPMSKIDKCAFSNDRHISKEEFDDFFIKD